ncbi:hypothetical protein M988_1627 [Hafnia paralvei ATCC 29927]|mgnify:FL=1|jgi:uncharacterized protein (DUF2164 family)|uniref:DUF2164 domain-containing protein n=1 Tax=Hafnia paralvei TaxID=546367 RepID=A0A2A2MF02_9GAMM|nr:DUF2164 domain-containing protein [Hafnia paralvei]EFV40998.1 hypothetical protein HMPREF0864_01522 [Enterobacteriaceae bacterium 9_2_54FAA]MDU1191153.1 DUF2164 domain-containing protein [Enterobacteriaceae bacterium]AMH18906.1 DUF2164 domain-containing protein [Hafnia paralvei]KHS47224.1 hypothetical protein RN38_07960 [Hafnia paralvei]MBU2674620.1 DUF2164 domain-containing protein [Hafnia paralvei]
MSEITFSRDQTAHMVDKLQKYLQRELDVEIGDFDAEFLLDFFAKELGAHFYNQGMADALRVVEEKTESLVDTLTWLQKPID